MRRVLKLVAIAATGAFASAASGPNYGGPADVAGTVTAVSLQRTSGRAEVVIGFSGDVDVQDFALRSPHRIVVDLKGATLKMGPHAYDGIVRAGIKNIHIAQNTPSIVRVVLDVDSEREYVVKRGDAEVRVSLETDDTFEPWTVGPRPRTPTDTVTAVRSLAVVPAPKAQNQVKADAPVKQPEPKKSEPVLPPPPKASVAEATNVAVAQPPKVVPVASDAPTKPSFTSMTPMGALFDPSKVSQQQAGGRITVSFRDTDLREVLAVFAERSGRSIVTGLKGMPITAEIIDQPWQTALNEILSAYGLAAVVSPSGVIRVASYADIAALRSSEPLSTVRLPLNFARADSLAKTLTLLLSPDCGGAMQVVGAPAGAGAAAGAAGAATGAAAGGGAPAGGLGGPQSCMVRGKVTPEPTTNTLILTEGESRIDSLVAYAKSFDVQPQQVNIKAQIISINRSSTNQLGVSYDLGQSGTFFNTLAPRNLTGTATEFQVTLGGDAFAGVANAGRTFADGSAINLIYSTLIGNSTITSFIDALSVERLTDVQSVPSINTVDKLQAKLFSGSQERFLITPPTAAGAIQSQPAQISFIDVGIKLEVTPSISANRMIRLTIYAEQSSLLNKDAAGPSIALRKGSTEVIVRDGETAYLTGLEQTQATKSRRGIPLLMNLPLIGRLFSENETIEVKDDLIILITPHILDDRMPGPPGRH